MTNLNAQYPTHSVFDMYENGDIKKRTIKISNYLKTQGNHICSDCGISMELVAKTITCGQCGKSTELPS